MRSTSVTPPPDDPAPPAAAMDEDNDEIVFISDNMRTPAKNKAGPSAPSGATPSPTKKRRVAKMEDDDTVETPKKRGKKRARTEEDELTDEGLVSDELKVAAGVKDEKKVVGSSTSPGRGSPAKKVCLLMWMPQGINVGVGMLTSSPIRSTVVRNEQREIRKFTLEEDKLIIQQ